MNQQMVNDDGTGVDEAEDALEYNRNNNLADLVSSFYKTAKDDSDLIQDGQQDNSLIFIQSLNEEEHY